MNTNSAINIEERTLSELRDDLNAERITSYELTSQYMERIYKLDRNGPSLNSVIEINPDALAIASASDMARKESPTRGLLHGIPILIKANIDTLDGMATTAGSLALAQAAPLEDAFIVQKLRAAGAILFGKTNMSEWANARNRPSISGWSAQGGLTRNPYVLDRSASGSSSGSAVAVAASLCAAAVGTETDGSILSPASVCGIVGLKPTVGLLSRRGIIPISHSLDTPGPMARTVRDCALLLDALTGMDPQDSSMHAIGRQSINDYFSSLNIDSLRGARLGVARQFFGFHESSESIYQSAMKVLKQAGAILIDPVVFSNLDEMHSAKREVLLYEMKAGLNTYLQGLGKNAPVKTLAEIIAFNSANAAREMQWFNQNIFLMSQAKGTLNDDDYLNALAQCRRIALTDGIEYVMKENNLDALIAPTTGPASCIDLVLGDSTVGGSTSLAAAAGTPSISVCAGNIHGLPLGLSFFAESWSEMKLLNLAYAFEQISNARKMPGYLPRVSSI